MLDFEKTPGLPEDPKHFSEGEESSECLKSLWIFLYDLYKTLEVPGVNENISEVVEASECLSS